MFPVGGEDIDAMKGDLQLTFAAENEQPVKLLGDEDAEIPSAGEVLYRDDKGIICRCWNWREADRTKLTENTKNAILVVESVPPGTEDEISAAIEELSELVKKFCGGETKTFILNENNNEVEI
jgi:DNA/RNA-binding domain of Phe-tRNA-synthetase-like protein